MLDRRDKFFVGNIFKNLPEKGVPKRRDNVARDSFIHGRVVVISGPGANGDARSISDYPGIAVIVCCAGFRRHLPILVTKRIYFTENRRNGVEITVIRKSCVSAGHFDESYLSASQDQRESEPLWIFKSRDTKVFSKGNCIINSYKVEHLYRGHVYGLG